MPYYTPLRYPGGKRRLASAVMRLLEHNGLSDIHYAEPYAGGAAVALALLMEEYASVIHINDLDRSVFAFWKSVLDDTDTLCKRIERTKITMREWKRQKAIYERREDASLDDLGFATFFLNRTNRSGILSGGVIGGKQQGGQWDITARFNKPVLIQRIRKIARYKNRIRLYQMDAADFTKQSVRHLGQKGFVFYDPPYIDKGEDLYLDDYTLADHQRLAAQIVRQRLPWIVVYDYVAIRHRLYESHRRAVYWLHYVAQNRYRGREVMYVSDHLEMPRLAEFLGDKMHPIPSMSRLNI